MPRGKKAEESLTRTTVFLSDNVNENLACLALKTGQNKAELMRKAIAQFIENNGLDPNRKPKVEINVSY